ncbi:MAG: SMI1/KNR4 family protein [Cellvibrionaceae bacterium]
MSQEIEWDSYYGTGNIDQITLFEKKVGLIFPDSYKNIVSKYNGAYPASKDSFEFYNKLLKEKMVIDSGMFLPFGKVEKSNETMNIKWDHKPENFSEELLIFSALGNGDFLCFDYRKEPNSNRPSIVVFHQEGNDLSESISPVSNNFDDFLDLLFEE